MKDYLSGLNTPQKEAVLCTSGPILVIAGAGSGKTRVLTYKIAHLINSGINARKILALTFTNKAAREMKIRIAELIGEKEASGLWMGTFHSVFSKILRIEAESLGFTSNFTIFDTDDSKSMLTSIIKELQLDTQVYKTNEIFSQISMAKNNLITPNAYAANGELIEKDRYKKRPYFADIYLRYCNKCKLSNAMDFDDLLLNTNILFRDFPEILAKYQNKYSSILVDEYQDTNFSQYLIIKKLATIHKNICIVGDDSQSIYSFRGAKIENILNFKSDYPQHKIFKLEQNYRSSQNIVDAANSLIEKNKNRIPKTVFSEKDKGEKIKILKTFTDAEEGYHVAEDIINRKIQYSFNYSDFAILYRTNAQSRVFEEVFIKKNIPYKVLGSISFYQRKEIKDILAYFRLIINNSDEQAIRRIINYPTRGIGETSINKIIAITNSESKSFWEILCNINSYDIGLRGKAKESSQRFIELIQYFSSKLATESASDIADEIIKKTGLMQDLYNDKTPEGVERASNIDQLMSGIQFFCNEYTEGTPSLDKFVESIALLTDSDLSEKDASDRVTLMTVHSSKGLEFNNVYIAGAEEDLFPYYLSKDSLSGIEEERRLFYVALTRACKYAHISFAEQRFRFGDYVYSKPSRFISELDSAFIDFPSQELDETDFENDDFSVELKKYSKFQPKQTKSFSNTNNNTNLIVKPIQPAKKLIKIKDAKNKLTESNVDIQNFSIGNKVMHERFGKGLVLFIEGSDSNTKITVEFEKEGKKNLLLKFAKLKIISD